ncbi:Hypothetical_protein [Hexamita inflata]|uniref:Hypothetical_protein n=1 Tax=Hexamita inflata TaxID=28002 RepID=A0AA86Q8Z8_9EUKA|nr:Hypothetical protein HINF_LOCUS39267 [Hexamita inflata]
MLVVRAGKLKAKQGIQFNRYESKIRLVLSQSLGLRVTHDQGVALRQTGHWRSVLDIDRHDHDVGHALHLLGTHCGHDLELVADVYQLVADASERESQLRHLHH